MQRDRILSALVLSLLTSLLALISCQQETTSEKPPHILFIMVDDLGKEWVSSYGADSISTPHIDALAKSGVRFENVYCMPQCTPTRLTLLTGQYPFRHGWVNHWDVPRWGGGAHFDERQNPSLGLVMQQAGYSTCIAGKWQIDDFRVEPDALQKAGFDQWCMWTGGETGIPESDERYQNPYIYTSEGSKTYPDQFGPDIFRDFILDFIREEKNDKPKFIYYPMVLTHTPFVNTPDEVADDKIGKHKAMVRYTDKITGEIVQGLKDAGIHDETLIIWTTDNGTTGQITGHLNGVAVKGGKAKTMESGICVPFIASWPNRLAAGQASNALIDFTDLLPTFADIAGAALSDEILVGGDRQKLDGFSFAPILRGEKETSQRKWIMSMGGGNYAKLTSDGVENQFMYRDRVLRTERYKLNINAEKKPSKFYDLQNDPAELTNRIDSLNAGEREVFDFLVEAAESFPNRDSDPRYANNPPQPWDVEITAEAEVWKK